MRKILQNIINHFFSSLTTVICLLSRYATNSVHLLSGGLVLFFVFGSINGEAQYTILYNDSNGLGLTNNDVIICQEISDSLHLVRVIIDDDLADNTSIGISFPTGMNYLDGSLVLISEIGGLTIAEKAGSVPNAQEFEISPVDLSEGDEITFGYSRVADCAALNFQLAGGTFKDNIIVTGDSGTVTEPNINLANYDLMVPALSLFNEGPISTSVGNTVTREIRIVNGGLGYLNSVDLVIDDESNTNTTSLTTLSGTTLSPSSSGTLHSYHLDQSIITQFGNGDQKLENGEEIVLIRTYEVLACDCSSSYQAFWGCGGDVCSETEVLPQQTNIINTVPDLLVRIPLQNEEVCWDGSNALPDGSSVVQTVSVTNQGTGAAINFELTMHNLNPGSGRGRNYFSIEPWVIKNSSGSVIGTMTNLQTLATDSFYNSNCSSSNHPATMVQEATGITIEPGETILIEVPNYYSNMGCPNCPKGRSWMQLNGEYSYQDVCELNTYNIPRHPLYNGSHNFQRYNLELPTDVHDGECFNLGISYQRVYTFLRRYGLDGGYTEAVLDLASSGLTYNGGPTLNWNGVSLQATVVGGTLRLRFPPNIVHFGNLKVPVCISCATVGGGTIGFSMWHEILYSDNCSPVPSDQECSTGTFFLHCPSPCPEGGATPTSFDLERISLGLQDQDDNGIPDNNNPANPSDVELNRAVNGDLVKGTWQIYVHPNTVGTNADIPFDHVYIKFNTQKVNENCNPAETARTSYFDALPNAVATITPVTGAPYTCSVNPVMGTDGIATYDLSSCKSGWEGGDKITFEATFEVNAFVSKAGEVLYVADNEVYSSYVPNPSYADQHTCNLYNDYMVIYNLYHSPYMPYTQEISGCNNTAVAFIRQYISLQAPPGFFPNEYRNFGMPDEFIVDWPASQVYRPGSARFNGIPIPDSYVTQTGTQLIFTNLRQFFTPYGGSIIPPDEIISNHNVKWSVDPTCEAEAAFTSRFTAITLGNGTNTPISWPSNAGCNSLYSGNANFEYDAPLPVITGGGETQPTTLGTCWDVTLNNISNSQDAQNSWLYLEDQNGNLSNFQLYQGGTQIYPDANGFYRLGTNTASTSADYTICSDLADCEDLALEVLMGYHCTTYPTSISDSECISSVLLTGVPAQSEIQVLLESYPLDPANTCAEQVVELSVTSAQASFLDESRVEISLPSGVSIIGNIELEYPSGSGNWYTASPTLSGGVYIINLENHPGIDSEGIPGTFAEPDDEEREVILKFVVNNTGTAQGIVLNTFGIRPCGGPAINNGIETKTADLDPLVSDVNTDVTICPGDSYIWEGSEYTDPGIYEVFKVNDNGCNFSCVLYLSHFDLPVTSAGDDHTICAETSATITGTITGGFGTETYQWQESKNGGNTWQDIPGATSIDYTTPDLLATTSYRLITIFGDPGCGAVTSSESTITVEPLSVVSNVIAGLDTICPGSSTVLTVNDGIQNGGEIDYSTWTVGSGNVGSFFINGAVSENNRIIDNDPWGNDVVVWEAGNDAASDGDGGWATGKFPVDHTKTYRFSVWINRKIIGANGRAYLGVYGYGAVDGVNRLNNTNNGNPYFWYSGTPPTTLPEDEWVLVVGHMFPSSHTGTSLHPESGRYTLCEGKIGNTIADYKWLPETIEARQRNYLFYSTDTDVRQQFVYPRVDVIDGTEPTIDELLSGLDATGGLGDGATYEWFTGSCGGTSVGTGTTLPVSPTTTTTYYVRATGTCNTTDCEEVTITVLEPTVTIDDPSAICEGDSILLTAVGSGGAGILSYQWDDPSVATTDTVRVGPVATTTYQVLVTDESGCTATDDVIVEVEAPATIMLADQTICAGETASLTPTITGGHGSPTYQWQKSVNSGNSWTDIPGETNANYTTPTLLGTSYYRVLVSWPGSSCSEVESEMATITVDPLSIVSNVVAGQDTICPSESTLLTVNDGIQNGGSIDHSNWTNGTGTIAGFNKVGDDDENNRITDLDPWGNSTTVWEAQRTNAANRTDGGWNSTRFDIDHSLTYRFSVWVNRKVMSSNGRLYFGTRGYGAIDGVAAMNGSPTTNPYFIASSNPPDEIDEDEWFLLVGHVHSSGSTHTAKHVDSGIYTLCEGKVSDMDRDFRWLPETLESLHRNFLYDADDLGAVQQFVYPRVDVLDGNEPSIDDLLYGLDATGGLAVGDTYEWFEESCGGSPVGTGPTLTVMPAVTTTYYVRATGTCATTDCEEITITVNEPSVDIADPADLCTGESVLLTATGDGFGSLSYQWDDPSMSTTDTVTVFPSATTTYVVTVTDVKGCTTIAEVSVILNMPEDITVTNDGPITCSNGTVTLTATPTGMTYEWSSGGTEQTEEITTAGTYIVTVTNTEGCISIDSTEVLEDLEVPVALVNDAEICIGESATLTASGGGNYAWPSAETTETISVTPTTTTTYIVTVTSANGCSSTAESTVTVNPLPNNETAVWRHILCSPAKGWVYAVQAFPNVPAYLDNTVTEEGGASCGDKYLHTEGVSGYSVVAENLPGLITGGNTYEFSFDYKNSGSGAIYARIVFYDAAWTYINTTTITLTPSSTWTTATVTALAPAGAANTHIGLLVNDNASVDIDCFDLTEQGNGSIFSNSFEMIMPYSWTAPGGTPGAAGSAKGIYVTEPGTYTVTITDPTTGCVNVGTVEVLDFRDDPDLSVDSDGPISCGMTSVDLVATSSIADVTYEWNTGETDATLNVTDPDVYTVTVTDPTNGCTAEASIEVILGGSAEINSVSAACSVEDITVNYTTEGAATQAWIGIYEIGAANTEYLTWAWVPTIPGTDNLVFSNHGLQGGDYEARIFTGDAYEICGTFSFTILPDPIVDAGPDVSFCEGETTTIAATVTAGTTPYLISWTGPGGFTSSDLNPEISAGGVYTLMVTDDNGCTDSDELLVYVFDCDQESNCYFMDDFNNTMSYFNSNGTLSWSDYSWDEAGDNNSSSSGDLMIFDNKLLMEHSDSSLPTIKRRMDLTGHSSAVLSFDFSGEGDLDSDDSFYIEVFDGTTWTTLFTFSGPFSSTQMPWIDLTPFISVNTEIRFGIASGFSDAGERLFLDNVRIDVNCLCEGIADAGIEVVICESDSTTLVGTGGVEYLWSPPDDLSDANIANPQAFPTSTTTYSLTVTDQFGCTDTDEVTVTVNESLDAVAVAMQHDFCEDGSGEATITVTNGTGPFTVTWETISGTEPGSDTMDNPGSITITNLTGETTYCFFVTDANGCIVTP